MVLVFILIICASTLVGIQVEHHKAVKRLSAPFEPHELNTPAGMAPNDVEQCALFEIRLTQQKMVDAGIITSDEMITCDNKDCKNCLRTAVPLVPVGGGRMKMLRNERVPIPDGVPSNAHLELRPYNDGFSEALWSWYDDSAGELRSVRSAYSHALLTARPQRESKIKLLTPATRPSPPRGRGAVSPTKQACECCHYDITSGTGHVKTVVDQCQPCNMAEAGRRSTGNMGPL